MDGSILATIELDGFKNRFVEKVMVLKYKGLDLDTWGRREHSDCFF